MRLTVLGLRALLGSVSMFDTGCGRHDRVNSCDVACAPGHHGYPRTSDLSEDFKVSDGLRFNALQPGDKVQFSVEQANGAKTITKLEKR